MAIISLSRLFQSSKIIKALLPSSHGWLYVFETKNRSPYSHSNIWNLLNFRMETNPKVNFSLRLMLNTFVNNWKGKLYHEINSIMKFQEFLNFCISTSLGSDFHFKLWKFWYKLQKFMNFTNGLAAHSEFFYDFGLVNTDC